MRVGDDERHTLSAAWRGLRALGSIGAIAKYSTPRLQLDATAVQQPDAFSGVALARAIEVHLAKDRGNDVVLTEPRDPSAMRMLHDLLFPLPARARWASNPPLQDVDRRVLLPASRFVDDDKAELLGDLLWASAGSMRLPRSEVRLLVNAGVSFMNNAFHHAPEKQQDVWLAACHEPVAHDLQIVALSPLDEHDSRDDPVQWLREMLRRSASELGNLSSLMTLAARREVDVTLRIAADRGRVFWRSGSGARIDASSVTVPAFVASLEVHLRG